MENEYYTTREAAEVLGIHPSRVLQLIKSQKFKTVRKQRWVNDLEVGPDWKDEADPSDTDHPTRMRYVIDCEEVDAQAAACAARKAARPAQRNEYMRHYMRMRRLYTDNRGATSLSELPPSTFTPAQKILFVSTHTTGIPGELPRLLELTCLMTDGEGRELASYCAIVKISPIFVIPSISPITREMTEQSGQDIEIILAEFSRLYDACDIIVSHNVEFQLYILAIENQLSCHKLLFTKPSICTMTNSAQYVGIPKEWDDSGYKWPTLSELYKKLFGTQYSASHGLPKVRVITKCFFELVRLQVALPPTTPDLTWKEPVLIIALETLSDEWDSDTYHEEWLDKREELQKEWLRTHDKSQWDSDIFDYALSDVTPPSFEREEWQEWYDRMSSCTCFDYDADVEYEANDLVKLRHDHIIGITAIIAQYTDGCLSPLDFITLKTSGYKAVVQAAYPIINDMWARSAKRYIIDSQSLSGYESYMRRLLEQEIGHPLDGSADIVDYPLAEMEYILPAVEKIMQSEWKPIPQEA